MDTYKIHIFEDSDPDYIWNMDVKWGNISGDIHQQGDLMDLLDDITSGSVTLSEKIDEISGAVYTLDEWADKMADDLEALSGDVREIVGGDYLTREELEEMGYLTESGASETYQPITQFKTINNYDITGGTDNIEIYYDDTQVKADIQKLSGDIQTIVGGDFVTEDDLSAYTTVEYAESTYLKEVPASITNEIQSISAQVQTISGSYLTQDDLTPYATTAFTESTYLKEVPQSVMNDIQVVSGQVESLGNTVVSNSQNIQSLSGSLNDYLTESAASQTYQLKTQFRTINSSAITGDNTNIVISVPTSTSALTNDSGFLTSSDLKTINNSSIVGSGNITVFDVWVGSQQAYDNLPSYSENTIYCIAKDD